MIARLLLMAMVLLGPPGVTLSSSLAERAEEHEDASGAVEARDFSAHRQMVQPPLPARPVRFARRLRLRSRPQRRTFGMRRRHRSRRVARCVLYADDDDEPDPEA